MNGFVTGIMMKALLPKVINDGVASTTIGRIHNFNYIHKVFGHCGLDNLKKTAKMYDFKLSGKFEKFVKSLPLKRQDKRM